MGFFKKFKTDASKAMNKNALEAGIAAGLLVAAAEGGISKDEKNGVVKAVSANPKASSFSPRDINSLADKYADLLEENFRVGKLQMLREIKDINGNDEDAEDVLVLAISIAEKDGDIGEKEHKVLKEIADVLGLKLESYMG